MFKDYTPSISETGSQKKHQVDAQENILILFRKIRILRHESENCLLWFQENCERALPPQDGRTISHWKVLFDFHFPRSSLIIVFSVRNITLSCSPISISKANNLRDTPPHSSSEWTFRKQIAEKSIYALSLDITFAPACHVISFAEPILSTIGRYSQGTPPCEIRGISLVDFAH